MARLCSCSSGDANGVVATDHRASVTLMSQIVPVEIDLPEFGSIDPRALLGSRRVVTICAEDQRLPGGPERILIVALRTAEHVRARLRSDSAIALRFLLGSDRDAEAVERRVHQQRRILK